MGTLRPKYLLYGYMEPLRNIVDIRAAFLDLGTPTIT